MESVQPKVSIIVPVYKSEIFLKNCIDSLLCQTLKEIEIILIDDGSPDDSGRICDEYSKKNQNIKVFHQENKGTAYAIQIGINKADGEYVMLVDADDWIEKTTCEITYNKAVENHADLVFWPFIKEYPHNSVYGKTIIKTETVFIGDNLLWLKRRVMGLLGKELFDPTLTDAISSIWGKLFRRSIIENNKINAINSDGSNGYDVLFINKEMRYVNKAMYINQFLYHYRRTNENSVTKNYGLQLFDNFKQLFGNLKEIIQDHNLGFEYYEALNNRIALSIINNILSISLKFKISQVPEKNEHIKLILKDPVYNPALSQLSVKHMPIYWKVFFLCAKSGFSLGLLMLGIIMQRIRK